MIERTQADWDSLAALYGRAAGDLITCQRVVAEREAELQDVRAQLAAALVQIPHPPEPDKEG